MIKEYIYYHLKQVYPDLLPVDGRNSKNFYIDDEKVWIRFNDKVPKGATYENICFVREDESTQFMKNYFNYYLPDTSEAEMKKCLDYICDMYHLKHPSIEYSNIDYIDFYDKDYDAYIKRDVNPNAVPMDEAWNQWFSLLLSYKSEFGNLAVSKKCIYKGLNLGRWCLTTRKYYNKHTLTEDKINRLNEIGFVWDLLEYEWNRRYEQYKRYVVETASPSIARRTDYEGEHLGAWISTQKLNYQKGKMSQDRKDKLLALNKHIFDGLE